MKYLFAVLLVFLPVTMYGQEVLKIANQLKLKTPDTEVKDAIGFLKTEPKEEIPLFLEEDVPFIRFFSTYAVPVEKRNDYVLQASFIIHSLVGPSLDLDKNNAGAYYPLAMMKNKIFTAYKRVPGSDTLWWIDIRDYNWTTESWENMSSLDGYFVEPVVQHQNLTALRLLSGNAIVRLDWFIVHSSDMTQQLDTNATSFIYNELLYAQTSIPKTVADLRKVFSIDVDRARAIGNEYATIVTKSKAVAVNNRALFGYRTENGYWYETYDVKNQEGFRDYIESFFRNPKIATPPATSDAGEIFGSNQLGLQIYALRDQNFNLVSFGDTTIVKHITDVVGDVRVRVPHSCMDCHAGGPLPSENTLNDFITNGVDLYLRKKEDRNRVKRVYLSNKFEQSIIDNQKFFSDALKRTNGLLPEENGKIYLDAVTWYTRPVDLVTAAFECGVTEKEFKDKVEQGRFGGRLKLLVNSGEPIPRDVWETRGKDGIPGQFQQAMILIHGLTKITEEVKVEENPHYTTKEDAWLMIGRQQLVLIPKNTKIEHEQIQDNWVKTTYNGKNGWVQLEKLEYSR